VVILTLVMELRMFTEWRKYMSTSSPQDKNRIVADKRW